MATKKRVVRKRKDARKVAFSLIYEYFFTNTKDDLELEQFIQMTDADDTVFEIDDSQIQELSKPKNVLQQQYIK